MGPLVSVIIPTYNRATLWRNALGKRDNSLIYNVLNQTYRNFDVIIVNDGSSDDSAEALSHIATLDSRIRIVNKTNGGPSDARNRGIEEANGEFIFFIDDDDEVPLNFIESFMQEDFQDFDLVIDSYSNQIGNYTPIQKNFPERVLFSRNDIISFLFENSNPTSYYFFPFAKRFRTEILRQKNIRFDKRYVVGEDRPFVMDYLKHVNSCAIINNHSYIVKSEPSSEYRMSQGDKPPLVLWDTFQRGYNYLLKYNQELKNDKISAYADNFIVSKFFEYLFFRVATRKKDKSDVKRIATKLRDLKIKKGNIQDKNIRLLYFFLIIIGFSPTLALFKLDQKLH